MRLSHPWQVRLRLWAAATLAAATALGLAGCNDDNNTDPVQITTVSNRADLVSGGDVMVQITLPPSAKADGLQVTANGRDVTAALQPTAVGASAASSPAWPWATTPLPPATTRPVRPR